uniref:Uncharacterized protein n=1 Tax=Anthurium amnicola TaxID=1678845 RepID=A0A1D1YQL0_9ARAE
MAYNSPNLQNPTAVYTVAGNGTPGMGVPMIFNNPPAMIATPSPPPQPGFFYFALFASVLVVAGSIMWGVSGPVYESCYKNCFSVNCEDNCVTSYKALRGSGVALLVIGEVFLLGVGFFAHHKIQQQQHQIQQQIYQQQMQQQVQMNQQEIQQTQIQSV